MRIGKIVCMTAAILTACAGFTLPGFAFSENNTVTPIYGEEPSSSSDASSSEASSSETSSPEAPPAGEEEPSSQSVPEPPPESEAPPASSAGEPPPDIADTPHGIPGDGASIGGQAGPIPDVASGRPVKARVKAVLQDAALEDGLFAARGGQSVVFDAVVEDGDLKGSAVSALRPFEAESLSRPLRAGDRVYLTLYQDDTDTVRGTFSDFNRSPAIFWALALAAALLLACVPRKAGLKLAAALALSGLLCALILIPRPSVLTASLVSAAVALLAGFVFYGVKYRTLAAAAGTAVSLAVTGVLAYAGVIVFKLSGVPDGGLLRMAVEKGVRLDMRGTFLAGVLFAALGALVMVCNAASAGVERRGDFVQGVREGARAMAPVAVTLFFVVMGGMVGAAALLDQSGAQAERIVSDERTAAALTVLVACLGGLAGAVPLTAWISVLLMRVRRREDGTLRDFHVMEWLNAREEVVFGRAAESLDRAIQAAAGSTVSVQRDVLQAEHKMENELIAEETALQEEALGDKLSDAPRGARRSAGKARETGRRKKDADRRDGGGRQTGKRPSQPAERNEEK